ncbi:MAG TPA: hypothetical protein PLT00_11125 [Verrucomicrobiota bacterium]|nr:MAG: hypothetical protein BWX84_01694 [Verrucomicrobia bacterium ADurb.Bin118]HPY30878.1 hypothetical protein [Verrucomicrobiota bacterium]HQB17252.1 hypothetical protein [Verrucomicrobiota bacterium]
MKLRSFLSYGFALAAVVWVLGCGKCDTCNDAAGPSQNAAPAAGDLSDAAAQAADQVKALAGQAADKAQDLINQVRSLVEAKKYNEASGLLAQLANLKLTPEQQKTVGDLKTTIQQALSQQATSKAAEAVSGMLGGKK